MTSVRGVHYIRTVTPILGHGSVKVSSFFSRSLSSPETSVLERGLNFAPTPKEIPVVDIITETEYAIKRLQYDKNNSIDENSVAELRARVTGVLKSAKPPKSNITKEERDALSELRKDNKITVLPADKGRAPGGGVLNFELGTDVRPEVSTTTL